MFLRAVYRRAITIRRYKSTDAVPKGIPYTDLTIGIPKETYELEQRVAASPESVERLLQKKFKAVHIETNAGAGSFWNDATYEKAGATIVKDAWQSSDIILKVWSRSIGNVLSNNNNNNYYTVTPTHYRRSGQIG